MNTVQVSHPLLITHTRITTIEGGYSFYLLSHKSISLYWSGWKQIKNGSSIHMVSPVKGRPVQCSWCLQCIYTRYVTVWARFRRPKAQSAQLRSSLLHYSCTQILSWVSEDTHTHAHTPVQVILLLSMKATWSAPPISDKIKGITDQRSGGDSVTNYI